MNPSLYDILPDNRFSKSRFLFQRMFAGIKPALFLSIQVNCHQHLPVSVGHDLESRFFIHSEGVVLLLHRKRHLSVSFLAKQIKHLAQESCADALAAILFE